MGDTALFPIHPAGSKAASPLGVVKKGITVLVALVRRHHRAASAVVCRAVGSEVPDVVEKETGPAAVRRVPKSLFAHP